MILRVVLELVFLLELMVKLFVSHLEKPVSVQQLVVVELRPSIEKKIEVDLKMLSLMLMGAFPVLTAPLRLNFSCDQSCILFLRICILCQKFSLACSNFQGPYSSPCSILDICVEQDTKYQHELAIIFTKLRSIQSHSLRIHISNINLVNSCFRLLWSYVPMQQFSKKTKGLQIIHY